MCCSPHRFAVRAATHYHTRAWQTLIYGKDCFILLLYNVVFVIGAVTVYIPSFRPEAIIKAQMQNEI